MKNPVSVLNQKTASLATKSGHNILVSPEDLPSIEGYYWRVIGGVPVSVQPTAAYEVRVPLLNILQNKHRSLALTTENGDQLDCRRENWKSEGSQQNSYVQVDSRTVKLTIGQKSLLVDDDMAYYLSQYNWQVRANKGTDSIYCFVPSTSTRVSLSRYITKAPSYSKVKFKNGNDCDYRTENLEVYYYGEG